MRQKSSNLAGRDFSERNLREIDLNGANLRNASFRQARMEDANLEKATLNGADFLLATLSGATLSDATLSGANLSGATLTGANLFVATLTGADLSDATLTGANLFGAKLSGADLLRATLSGVDLYGATLSGADFRQAQLWGANFFGAQTEHIRFTPTNQPLPDAAQLAEIAKSTLDAMWAGWRKDEARERFADWGKPDAAADIRRETEKLHIELQVASAASTPQQRARFFGELACADPHGAYILRRLTWRDSDYISLRQLAAAIADPACVAANDLDKKTREWINFRAALEPPLPTASTAAPPVRR